MEHIEITPSPSKSGRSIRPRPIDIDTAMPIFHFKTDSPDENTEPDREEEKITTTTTTISTTLTTTITTTTTTKTSRGRGRPRKHPKPLKEEGAEPSTILPEIPELPELPETPSPKKKKNKSRSRQKLRATTVVVSTDSEVPLHSTETDSDHTEKSPVEAEESLHTPQASHHEEPNKVMEEIPIPRYEYVDGYDEEDVQPFNRPDCYVIYQEKPKEEIEQIIDYECDIEDERFLTRLKIDFPDIEVNDELLEKMIHLLEIQAHKKKGVIFTEDPNLLGVTTNSPGPHSPMTRRITASSSNLSLSSDPNSQTVPKYDDVVCCICGDGDSYDSNVIVLCDGCDVAVHQMCYGVTKIPEDEWLCATCKDKAEGVSCDLCKQTGGAFKKTTSGGWVHLVCSFWTPDVRIPDPIKLEPIDISRVSNERMQLICTICSTKGSCIQCKDRQCYILYHPSCCLKQKFLMEIKKNRAGNIAFETFCSDHSAAKSAEIYRSSVCEGEVRPEFKVAVGMLTPAFKKMYRLPGPVVESICKYWIDKRKRRQQPLLRHLQEYTDNIVREGKRKKRMKKNTLNGYMQLKLLRSSLERMKIMLSHLNTREDLKKSQILAIKDIVEHQITTGEELPINEKLNNLYLPMDQQPQVSIMSNTPDTVTDKKKRKSNSTPGKLIFPSLESETPKKNKTNNNNNNNKHKRREEHANIDGIGEVFNLHCHHCKKRRPRCAVCPFNQTHRYCQNCVKRHFNLDYDELALNPSRLWTRGCPKCEGICPCAVCRNASNREPSASSHSRSSAPVIRTRRPSSSFADEDSFLFSSSSSDVDTEPPYTPIKALPPPEPVVAPLPLPASAEKLVKPKKEKSGKKKGRPPKKRKSTEPEAAMSPVPEVIPLSGALPSLFSTDPGSLDLQSILNDFSIPFAPAPDIICEGCFKGDDEERLILCDKCDKGYHIYCLYAPLPAVPSGTWYCDRCTATEPSVDASPVIGATKPVRTAKSRPASPMRVTGTVLKTSNTRHSSPHKPLVVESISSIKEPEEDEFTEPLIDTEFSGEFRVKPRGKQCVCCHVCRRSVKKFGIEHLACSTCWCVVCKNCFGKRLDQTWDQAKSEFPNWSCTVCKGTCNCQRCKTRGPQRWFGHLSDSPAKS